MKYNSTEKNLIKENIENLVTLVMSEESRTLGLFKEEPQIIKETEKYLREYMSSITENDSSKRRKIADIDKDYRNSFNKKPKAKILSVRIKGTLYKKVKELSKDNDLGSPFKR